MVAVSEGLLPELSNGETRPAKSPHSWTNRSVSGSLNPCNATSVDETAVLEDLLLTRQTSWCDLTSA